MLFVDYFAPYIYERAKSCQNIMPLIVSTFTFKCILVM